MLFYTTLLIISFLLTLAILGLKYLVVFVARKAFGSGNRVVVASTAAHRGQMIPGESLKATSADWGTLAAATPATLSSSHSGASDNTPWGWPRNDHESREHHPRPVMASGGSLNAYLARQYDKNQSVADMKRNMGRPARDDSSALAGAAYRPSQDTISKYGID